ncbi:MAG: hypothetical protein QXT45_04430 [Candidatus Bilamarchaeaceae archaeon]
MDSKKNLNFEPDQSGLFVTKSGRVRRRKKSLPQNAGELIRNLLKIHCTLHEVSAFFEVHHSTIEEFCRREFGVSFSEVSQRFQAQGKISLRRQLWRKAVEDNDLKAQIFLAKNYLGMADRVEFRGDDGNYQFVLAYRLREDESNAGDGNKD